jgi:hypothetical protein
MSRAQLRLLCVSRTDNAPRVRDGYISESTRGHTRALPTHSDRPICRTNVPANDRACTPVPPQNFHGKEGVGGSSPPEGSEKAPQIAAFSVIAPCRSCSMRWVWSRLWSLQVPRGFPLRLHFSALGGVDLAALTERLRRCLAFNPTERYAFSDHSPIVATFEV